MIVYKHIDSSLSTIADLLNSDNTYSIINVGAITKIELFSYSGLTNNLDNIYNTYSGEDKGNYKNNYAADKIVLSNYESQKESINKLSESERKSSLNNFSSQLKISQIDIGTILYIPDYAVNQENVIVQSNQNVKQETFKDFYVNELRILELDSEYRHISEELDGNLGVVKKKFPVQTVWLWSKSLSEDDSVNGKIINLSPFILSLNTTVTETGGNWSLTLPSVVGKYNNGWEGITEEFLDSNNIVSKGSFQSKKRGSNYYFYNIIQPNDILFIRFETLRNEVKKRFPGSETNKSFFISPSELSSGIYDMIGLVDTVNIAVNPSSSDVVIEVQGRDLVKLLIEDGTYFFATDYIEGGAFVQNQNSEARNLANRRVEGKLLQLSLSAVKSIDFSLKFIINALSSIKVCNDNVFSSYKNAEDIVGYDYLGNKFITKRTDITSKRYEISFKDKDKTQFELTEEYTSGIWQIIKLVIDENIEGYRQVDATLGNEMGSILNAINKVCQKPFIEFFTDTYRNQFFFIARRPPFDYLLYKSLSDVALTIESSEVVSYNLNFNDQEVYSWFRLQPQAAVDELGIQGVWSYLKAIRFEEYASIFGDKCLTIVSNYIHYQNVIGENEVLNVNSMTRQFIRDFQYLIESNQYKPFVRSGQIIMNGDRRIKRGTIVFFEETQEFCYVDAVSQSYNMGNSIDRTTVLNVSRCMVKDYLEYYFKIIDLPLDNKLFTNADVSYIEFVENIMNNWKVNPDFFNFFLLRKQFINGKKIRVISKLKSVSLKDKLREYERGLLKLKV